jgi:hypothetical protein
LIHIWELIAQTIIFTTFLLVLVAIIIESWSSERCQREYSSAEKILIKIRKVKPKDRE